MAGGQNVLLIGEQSGEHCARILPLNTTESHAVRLLDSALRHDRAEIPLRQNG